MKKSISLGILFLSTMLLAQTTYVSDNFNYPAGNELTEHGWYAHSAAGTNPILVGTPGLSWAGYIGSGVGNAALINNIGQDINKPFSSNISSESVYASFLMKVSAPFSADGTGFFMHYGYFTNNLTPDADYANLALAFRGRTFVVQGTDPDTQFKLGLSFNATATSGETSDLNIGQTYLVVLKYEFIAGELNDEVSLYVFAEGDDIATEPATPTIGPFLGTAADAPALQAIALRQYHADQDVTVDGLYVKNTWDIEACLPVSGTDTRTECSGFTWIDGNTYDESNNSATFTILGGAVNGCDSLVTLNLTVIEVNATVSLDGNTLSAGAMNAGYQWLDCNSGNSPIAGQTEQSFTPQITGSYAVEVVQNGCSATSECLSVTVVGIEDFAQGEDFSIFPNPTNGLFTISWKTAQQVTMQINNALGQKFTDTHTPFGTSIDVQLELPAGIYFVTLFDENNSKTFKRLVIQ